MVYLILRAQESKLYAMCSLLGQEQEQEQEVPLPELLIRQEMLQQLPLYRVHMQDRSVENFIVSLLFYDR